MNCSLLSRRGINDTLMKHDVLDIYRIIPLSNLTSAMYCSSDSNNKKQRSLLQYNLTSPVINGKKFGEKKSPISHCDIF